jgi:hypothetical protein
LPTLGLTLATAKPMIIKLKAANAKPKRHDNSPRLMALGALINPKVLTMRLWTSLLINLELGSISNW